MFKAIADSFSTPTSRAATPNPALQAATTPSVSAAASSSSSTQDGGGNMSSNNAETPTTGTDIREYFTAAELYTKIAGYLDDKSLGAFFQTCKDFNAYRNIELPKRFLKLVKNGEQDKAERLLKANPNLLMGLLSAYGMVTDHPAGRTFKRITAFQCALWDLDVRYMTGMILRCLPQNETGEAIRLELLRQFEELEAKGVTYTMNGQTRTEMHFDFEPLLTALETYADSHDVWVQARNWAAMKAHWIKVVGMAQRAMPRHVFHHYFDPEESFAGPPTFDKEKLTRRIKVHNIPGESSGPAALDRLGLIFGIIRNSEAAAWGMGGGRRGYGPDLPGGCGARRDVEALTALCKKRTADLQLLKEQLQKPIQKPDDPQVSSCSLSP